MLLWLCPLTCIAEEEHAVISNAVLTVSVTNGTKNGTTVEGDEANILVYQHNQLLHTLNGKVNANGEVVFENVSAGDHMVAVVQVKHKDMMFGGSQIILSPSEDKYFANVQVFDVSDDQSPLSVQTHHVIIKARSDALAITEYMQLNNSSDMAIISKQRDSKNRSIVVEIMLPEGYKNFQSSAYFEEKALVFTEKGFYDTMAVPPGEYPITFSYTININSENMDIVKKIYLPTSSFVVFAELGQAVLQGLGTSEKVNSANGTPMNYYKLINIAPGEEVAFKITGFNIGKSDLTTWIVLAMAIGVVMFFVIIRLRTEKK
jgi:hypothetical protein